MDVAITRMSSKGQVVIPAEMRKKIKTGDKPLIIENQDQLIMKKANELDQQLEQDLKFARRTEEAWKEYEKGKFISMEMDEFLKEAEKG